MYELYSYNNWINSNWTYTEKNLKITGVSYMKLHFMNLHDLFGTGPNLTTLQMAVRSFVMFFIALALIRIGGMRIFGKKTAFDNVLSIMLGAILARGVIGATPF